MANDSFPLWIHCNTCSFMRFSDPMRNFFFKDCFHVSCEKCKVLESRDNCCRICKKQCTFVCIDENMPKNVKEYFEPLENPIKQAMSALMRNEDQYNKIHRRYFAVGNKYDKIKKSNRSLLTSYQQMRENSKKELNIIKTLREEKNSLQQNHTSTSSTASSLSSLGSLDYTLSEDASVSERSNESEHYSRTSHEISNNCLASSFIAPPTCEEHTSRTSSKSQSCSPRHSSSQNMPHVTSDVHTTPRSSSQRTFARPAAITDRSMISSVSSINSFGDFHRKMKQFNVFTSTPKPCNN